MKCLYVSLNISLVSLGKHSVKIAIFFLLFSKGIYNTFIFLLMRNLVLRSVRFEDGWWLQYLCRSLINCSVRTLGRSWQSFQALVAKCTLCCDHKKGHDGLIFLMGTDGKRLPVPCEACSPAAPAHGATSMEDDASPCHSSLDSLLSPEPDNKWLLIWTDFTACFYSSGEV